MKKKIGLFLSVILVFSAIISGCNSGETLKLENGILSWESVESAVSYEVNYGTGNERCEESSFELMAAFQEDGEYEVTVSAIYEDNDVKKIGSMTVTATVLEKPRISVQGSGAEFCFVINAVEGAVGYSYIIDDGEPVEIEIATGGFHQVPITDSKKQEIHVIAYGTSEGTNIICSSENTYSYLR